MRPVTTEQLVAQRVQAAADLEAVIAALGVAYRAFSEATAALESRVGQDLTRYLEVPIVLHLARAGLGGFLERKLSGTPASLRTLVEEQHRRAQVHESAGA